MEGKLILGGNGCLFLSALYAYKRFKLRLVVELNFFGSIVGDCFLYVLSFPFLTRTMDSTFKMIFKNISVPRFWIVFYGTCVPANLDSVNTIHINFIFSNHGLRQEDHGMFESKS